jgi:nicotinate-nucleotide adenylyltransferase
MDFFRKASGVPARLGILPGTFNPITVAHIGLAQAALELVDEVVFVLPRAFPHKPYAGASFTERVKMLNTALAGEPAFSIAATGPGLFIEIAEACRAVYGDQTRQSFLCGRDAAERILGWDYGDPATAVRMLQQFDLLVADRSGEYQPPPGLSQAIRRLPLAAHFDPVSATEVRERIARREPWEHLVPPSVLEQVRAIYS